MSGMPLTVYFDQKAYYGRSISSILSEANQLLGGCVTGDVNAMSTCLNYINRAFVDGKRFWEVPDFHLDSCN